MTPRERTLAKYGMTEADYDALLEAQDGRCAICGNRALTRRLVVDHDHLTQRIRGLLCGRTNRALGPFEYSVPVMERLIVYLQAIIADRSTWTPPPKPSPKPRPRRTPSSSPPSKPAQGRRSTS